MKRLFVVLLTLGMLLPGFGGVSAQAEEPALVTGLNTPAAFIDERGDTVATVQVTEIEDEWTEYNEYSAPKSGIVYRAIHFTVTNESDAAIIVEPYDFTLVDDMGRNNSRSWVSVADDASVPMFEEDLPLSAGDSAELMLVFEMYDDIFPSVFVWQADSGKLVMVDLEAESHDASAYSVGFNAPSTWTDDRMRPVAALEVTGVEMGWEDYGQYDSPEAGTSFVAVHLTVEALGRGDVIAEPYDFTLVDAEGNNISRSWASASEESGLTLFTEDTPISSGDTLEATMIFQVMDGVDPVAMVWQPDSGILNIVNFQGEELSTGTTAPASTPEVEEPDATEEATEEATTTGRPRRGTTTTTETATADATEEATEEATTTGRPRRGTTQTATEETTTTTATTGTATEVNGQPITFVNGAGDEVGTVRVISTQDGWDEYASNTTLEDGTHFYLVTVEVIVDEESAGGQYVSVLDFTLVLEDGTVVESDLFLNADDAQVQISEGGINLASGESATVVIPFIINDGDVPVEITWNTGIEELILNLLP